MGVPVGLDEANVGFDHGLLVLDPPALRLLVGLDASRPERFGIFSHHVSLGVIQRLFLGQLDLLLDRRHLFFVITKDEFEHLALQGTAQVYLSEVAQVPLVGFGVGLSTGKQQLEIAVLELPETCVLEGQILITQNISHHLDFFFGDWLAVRIVGTHVALFWVSQMHQCSILGLVDATSSALSLLERRCRILAHTRNLLQALGWNTRNEF